MLMLMVKICGVEAEYKSDLHLRQFVILPASHQPLATSNPLSSVILPLVVTFGFVVLKWRHHWASNLVQYTRRGCTPTATIHTELAFDTSIME